MIDSELGFFVEECSAIQLRLRAAQFVLGLVRLGDLDNPR